MFGAADIGEIYPGITDRHGRDRRAGHGADARELGLQLNADPNSWLPQLDAYLCDLKESQISGETEYDFDHAYEDRRKDYFRTDIKFAYRVNRKKATHEFALDINNIFDTQNIFQQTYNAKTNSVKTEYQLGFLPIPMYKLTF